MAEEITEPQAQITIYGTVWCSDCKHTKQFLRRAENTLQLGRCRAEPGGHGLY